MRIKTTATIARSNRKIFFAVSCSLNKKYAVSAVIKIYNEWIDVIKGNGPFVRAIYNEYPPKKLKTPIKLPMPSPPEKI